MIAVPPPILCDPMMIVLGLAAEIPKSVVHQTLKSKRLQEHRAGDVSEEAVLSTFIPLFLPYPECSCRHVVILTGK